MSDPVIHLKRELLAAAERQQRHTVLAPKGRRRWLERFRFAPRRRLVVVLAAVAVATAVTTAGWAIVREVVFHESVVGLPPVGATPSAPESGELVIQYRFDTEDIGAADGGRGWVYADGRLLTADARPMTLRENSALPEAATPWSSGLLEQRLTPEGVELMRSEIVSTGLFEHHEPAGRMSSPHNVIQVRIGDRLVRAQAKGAAASDEFPKRLRERLANPASWLPASAWANRRLRPYVPSRYDVFYGGLIQTVERSSLLPLLPAAAEDLLRSKEAVPRHGKTGDPSSGSEYPITRYVSALTTDEARTLARALDGARLEIPGTSVDLLPPNRGRGPNSMFFVFLPYLPHGESECLPCG
jgi:hypothetical protein